MARFTSKKYPELVVKFGLRNRVKFTKGEVEVTGEQAELLNSFAERHPEYEVEQVEGDEKPLTPKQKAVAKATELGLDASGTQAEIEARIAAFEADEDPEDEADEDEDADDSDDEDSDEDSDADDSDDA